MPGEGGGGARRPRRPALGGALRGSAPVLLPSCDVAGRCDFAGSRRCWTRRIRGCGARRGRLLPCSRQGRLAGRALRARTARERRWVTEDGRRRTEDRAGGGDEKWAA